MQTTHASSSNCKRAGSSMCSIVFMLDHSEVDIQDPSGALKNYTDANTKSGNAITRQFCGNCGRLVTCMLRVRTLYLRT